MQKRFKCQANLQPFEHHFITYEADTHVKFVYTFS